MAAIGAFAAIESHHYGMGTLAQIGPGFFPTAIGIVLLLLGLATFVGAGLVQAGGETEHRDLQKQAGLDLRGWSAIVAGVSLFIAMTPYLGLVPGTFACVFVSALGDRTMSIKQSAVLATAVSVAGAVLFVWGLQIGLPYFGS